MNSGSAHAIWARPVLAAQVLRSRRDGCVETALRVEGLQDARRVLWLEQRIDALAGVQRVTIERAAQRVRVIWDPRRLALPLLLENFDAAGCPAQPLQHDCIDDSRSNEQHDALKRLLVAGMCAMQVMTYAFVIYIGVVDFVDFSTRNLFRWLGLITTIPVVFYSAQPFFVGAVRDLRAHRLGIHVPVALAVGLTFLASMVNTLRGSGDIYFDSVSMFVFLLLGGRYLELRSRHRSGALGDAATDATPPLAQRRCADGSLETVAAMTLLPGDRVHVAEGCAVPADGVLESAGVHVDEALLSGESLPVQRLRGEALIAGSVLLSEPADLRVERSGADTTAARLSALARRARQERTSVAGGDRQINRFVARVLVLTLLMALGWLLVDPSRAFEACVAVLVVACPCAFALTQPITLTRALGVLARRGVLVANSAALLTLARVDGALFDKTGTLSVSQLDRRAIEPLRGDSADHVLQLAAALSRESTHPLAHALVHAAGQPVLAMHAQMVSVSVGAGISGTVEGRLLWLGRADFALAASGQSIPSLAADALLLADEQGALAAFHLEEQPRANARRVLDTLRAAGVTCVIASGDSESRVAALAARLGLDTWHARQSPTDKFELLQLARRQGHVMLAVGDGSNDAPLLATADVSVALSSGTDLAMAHADLLLMDGRLDGLIDARMIAVQVQQITAGSLRWSLLYNLCAVPFAAFGFVPPWLAAIGMSLSSLLVVLNALRVGGKRMSREVDASRALHKQEMPA